MAQLGVAGQVTDKDDAVDVCHGFRSSPTGRPRLLVSPGAVIGSGGGGDPVAVVIGRGRSGRCACRDLGRRLGVAVLDAPEGTVTGDTVGDLQDAGDLGERLGWAGEEEEVVDSLALVRDLVSEAP